MNKEQEKQLKMVKTFHISPATAATFEELRLELFRSSGLRVGSSDFFEYLVREAAKKNEKQ
jgi:hypothetical protein